MISPILPPVIISDAITNVYIVIAVWMPVTVVPRSSATVAMAVFMTVVSSAITNWPAASVSSTTPAAAAAPPTFFVIGRLDTADHPWATVSALRSAYFKVSDGTRTRDRLDHNQELYQLSYAHQA